MSEPSEHDLRGDDLVGHELSRDCPCGPIVEWFDPETGEAFEAPLVIHLSLDAREQQEDADG